MINNSTLSYYNNHAKEFIDTTFNASVSSSLDKFVSLLPSGASILDVGCGAGRDTLAFLNKGFQVTAFDASKELAELASQKIQHPIIVETIENMSWSNQFDGIWAMASLLHLKKEDLPNAITQCVKALKEDGNGLFYSAFKMGNGESYDDKGRFFSYYQLDELKQILDDSGYFQHIDFYLSGDVLGRSTSWINFIAEKKPQLILRNKETHKKIKY